jgi:hypothetical protein
MGKRKRGAENGDAVYIFVIFGQKASLVYNKGGIIKSGKAL